MLNIIDVIQMALSFDSVSHSSLFLAVALMIVILHVPEENNDAAYVKAVACELHILLLLLCTCSQHRANRPSNTVLCMRYMYIHGHDCRT